MQILVTGGAGYIGSHTSLQLLSEGHDVLVIDNLSNGNKVALERIQQLSNRPLDFHQIDIRQRSLMREIVVDFSPDVVIHFAGLKSVAESVINPLEYYDHNVNGSLNLLFAMDQADCKRIVFSSSATVYGNPKFLPYTEDHPLAPVNPYGRTKLNVEEILKDWAQTDTARRVVSLRYFNPIGAHESGLIGESPTGQPNNLMPFISQVASGKQKSLKIFGNDYDTRDGTGERDYIHVMDLAKAHVKAINAIANLNQFEAINIGTGYGTTVLELVRAFENASGLSLPQEITGRRDGDLPAFWADSTAASIKLNWNAAYGIEEAVRDFWNWQTKNPKGY